MSSTVTWLRRHRVAVLMGGRSAEREISLRTGAAILASLQRQGVPAVAIDPASDWVNRLRRHRTEFAYLALHGPGGEDGTIQGFLECLGIPYTGSGVLASALAMDKIATKQVLAAEGLSTAPWRVLTAARPASPAALARPRLPFGFPIVVKPACQGSAVGVSIVRRASEWPAAVRSALAHDKRALVEPCLLGPEVTVGLVGTQVLPVVEIVPAKDRPFYDFTAKYAPGGSQHLLPARLSAVETRRVQTLAQRAAQVLGTRGAVRVDFIVDRRRGPMILEVNTIPGMTETSLLPEAARAAGMDFDALVVAIAALSLPT